MPPSVIPSDSDVRVDRLSAIFWNGLSSPAFDLMTVYLGIHHIEAGLLQFVMVMPWVLSSSSIIILVAGGLEKLCYTLVQIKGWLLYTCPQPLWRVAQHASERDHGQWRSWRKALPVRWLRHEMSNVVSNDMVQNLPSPYHVQEMFSPVPYGHDPEGNGGAGACKQCFKWSATGVEHNPEDLLIDCRIVNYFLDKHCLNHRGCIGLWKQHLASSLTDTVLTTSGASVPKFVV